MCAARPIYIDYQATTPVDTRVMDVMTPFFTEMFGNPHSTSHSYGWEARDAVEAARVQVAGMINADPREVIFTSGATESNNMAIKGVGRFFAGRKGHMIAPVTEHKCVLESLKYVAKLGYEITLLPVGTDGLLDPAAVKDAIRDDTALVSVMHVNNEIGVIQDIAEIGEMCRARKIIFHVDAAQSAGKINIDLQHLKVDLMSFSAHKIYGPKGIGALYVSRKPRVRLESQIHGGGHERGMRSGTLATHQIVGMGEAFRIAKEELAQDEAHVTKMRDRLWAGLNDMEQVFINGDADKRYPGNLNVSFNFVEGESLIMALKDLAVSSGSACTSASLEPSYVLRALGLNDEMAHSSIRFSFGRFTTEEEIDYAIDLIKKAIGHLRDMSPLWEMFKDGIDLDSIEWAAH